MKRSRVSETSDLELLTITWLFQPNTLATVNRLIKNMFLWVSMKLHMHTYLLGQYIAGICSDKVKPISLRLSSVFLKCLFKKKRVFVISSEKDG